MLVWRGWGCGEEGYMVFGGDFVVFFCWCLCKDVLFDFLVGGCIILIF